MGIDWGYASPPEKEMSQAKPSLATGGKGSMAQGIEVGMDTKVQFATPKKWTRII